MVILEFSPEQLERTRDVLGGFRDHRLAIHVAMSSSSEGTNAFGSVAYSSVWPVTARMNR